MKKFCFIAFALLLTSQPAMGQGAAEESDNGLTLPRMVAFRSNLVNARSGPGSRYPIEWVYKQKGAPVEIISEFDLWRKVRDWEGSETWVHKSMLNNARQAKIVAEGLTSVYAKPLTDAKIIANVEKEVIGKIQKCPEPKEFCLIKFDGAEGWVKRSALFGVYPDETIN